jgi:DnaJ-class molecular chaperone
MPAPTQILPTTAERPCFWCNGSGRTPNDDEQRYDTCSACEGAGVALARQLAEPIAA